MAGVGVKPLYHLICIAAPGREGDAQRTPNRQDKVARCPDERLLLVTVAGYNPGGHRHRRRLGAGLRCATGAELARLDHDGDLNTVAFSPDGTRVATGSRDGSARVFQVEVGALIQRALCVMTPICMLRGFGRTAVDTRRTGCLARLVEAVAGSGAANGLAV